MYVYDFSPSLYLFQSIVLDFYTLVICLVSTEHTSQQRTVKLLELSSIQNVYTELSTCFFYEEAMEETKLFSRLFG